MKKKCIIFVAVLLLNAATVSASLEDDKTINTDAELLNAMGIEAVCGDEYISRGGFLALAMQAADIEPIQDQTTFLDVDVKSELGKYIATAQSLGYVNGYDDKTFKSETTISTAEAVSICERLLGYVIDNNNFSDGGIKDELYKNLTLYDKLTFDAANRILLNMLSSHPIEVDVSSGKKVYKKSEYSMMEKEHGVKKEQGIIEGIGGVSLVGSDVCGDTQILINGELYNRRGDLKRQYLGCDVVYYSVDYKDGDSEIIYMKRKYDDQIKITGYDIQDVVGFDKNDSYEEKSKPEITYLNKNDKSKTAKVSKEATVIVNDAKRVSVTNADFDNKSSRIILTDTDSNNVIDVVYIESYEYYKVKSVDYERLLITDLYYKESLNLDMMDDIEIYYNDERKAITDICEGQTLSVQCSHTQSGEIDINKPVRIHILNNNIEGVVQSYLESEHENSVVIDGVEYNVSESMNKPFRIGETNTYNLGELNEIIFMDEYNTDTNNKYAVLVKHGPLEDIPDEERLYLKVFMADGEMKRLQTDRYVLYSGMLNGNYVSKRKINSTKLLDLLTPKTLIKINEENGLLIAVENAVDYSNDSDYKGFNKEKFTMDYHTDNKGRLYNGIASENYFFDGSETVFVIPSNGSDTTQFAVGKQNIYGNNISGVNLSIYDSNELMSPKVAVIKVNNGIESLNTYTDFYADTKATVIYKKTEEVNENNEVITVLYGMIDGRPVRLVAKNDELKDSKTTNWRGTNAQSFNELDAGDVIQYRIGADGKVDLLHILLDFDANDIKGGYIDDDGQGFVSLFNTTYGHVTRFERGSYFMLDGSETRKFRYNTLSKIHIYDLRNNTVTVEDTLTHLDEDDFVFVACRRATVNSIVVYRR